MPSDTTLPGFQVTGFRLRRTHEKSRNGCVRCKQQRKKCDELRPSCSRCTKRMYRCRYQSRPSDDNLSGQEPTHLPVPDSHVPPQSPSTVVPGSRSPSARLSKHHSVSSPPSGGQLAASPGLSADGERLGLNSNIPDTLDATELGLLAHYITHTSQTIPFDDLDLYALSVGVPNMAFNSRAVMSSLLALAAACKSHDIAKRGQTLLDHRSLMQIRELLTLAERHHRASLRHIQATMHNSDSYDFVLANAALMVLYASASHSIRIHLAAGAKQCGQQFPDELLPQHSQWISFTRAAHIASTAVLNDIVDAADKVQSAIPSPAIDTGSNSPIPVLCGTGVLSPQDGPSENTKRLLLPLVASTYTRAFESLRRRAEFTVARLKRSELSPCNTLQLDASLESLSVLENCASLALSTREGNESVQVPRNHALSSDRSHSVSPWVASYMISVTSMESPRVLRRIIMSFLNKAPAEYLSFVRSVLDAPDVEAGVENGLTQDSPGAEAPSLNAAHLLAMDIFAHWLVLVMLLDGVWWIGDIGQWELSQVLSLTKTQNLLGWSVDTRETWWPESMYLVKRELNSNVLQ